MAVSVLCLPVPLILLVHLHILEYPFANNPEYDLNVFDPHVRGLRDRTKSMEDVCYFLICQLEGSKDRVKKVWGSQFVSVWHYAYRVIPFRFCQPTHVYSLWTPRRFGLHLPSTWNLCVINRFIDCRKRPLGMTTERERKQTRGRLWHGGGKMLSYENLL